MSHVPANGPLCTRDSLAADLATLGVRPGETLLVHTSLSALGWVNGGAVALVQALLDALGPDGTLTVPAFTADNSDPSGWSAPPVPQEWWDEIRRTLPAYDPAFTRTRGIGVVPEVVRNWPGAHRSSHPQTSFAAAGRRAAELTAGHTTAGRLGDASPLARLEEVGARVLLLGTGYDRCTAFHLAESRLPTPDEEIGFSVLTPSGPKWLTVREPSLDSDDFGALGADYESTRPVTSGRVGGATARLFPLAEAVAYAGEWLARNRAGSGRHECSTGSPSGDS